jgi:hypothetical protein
MRYEATLTGMTDGDNIYQGGIILIYTCCRKLNKGNYRVFIAILEQIDKLLVYAFTVIILQSRLSNGIDF